MFSKLKKVLKIVVAVAIGAALVIGAAMFLGAIGYAIGVVVCIGAALRLVSHPINWVDATIDTTDDSFDDSFTSKMGDIFAAGVNKAMQSRADEAEASANATMDTATGAVSAATKVEDGVNSFAEALGKNVAKELDVTFETLTDPNRWGNHGNKPVTQ